MNDRNVLELGTPRKTLVEAFGGWGDAVSDGGPVGTPVAGSTPEDGRTGEGPIGDEVAIDARGPRSAPEDRYYAEHGREAHWRLLGSLSGSQGPLSENARREIVGMTIELFLRLAPTTLAVRLDDEISSHAMFTTSFESYNLAAEHGMAAFAGGELKLIAYAAQNDRLWSTGFRVLVAKKQRDPKRRVQPSEAVGAVYGLDPLTWNLGRVFRRLHVTLVAFAVHERKS